MGSAKKKNEDGKSKENPVKVADESTYRVLEGFGEAILTDLNNTDQDKLEVFELYTHNLRSKFYSHESHFPADFAKGYETLVEALKN